jgi:hypothetical protein
MPAQSPPRDSTLSIFAHSEALAHDDASSAPPACSTASLHTCSDQTRSAEFKAPDLADTKGHRCAACLALDQGSI